MSVLGLLVGAGALAAVIWAWYRIYRSVKGDDALFRPDAGQAGKRESLEDFVAAYRRGEVNLHTGASAPQAVAPATAAAPAPPPSADPPAGPAPFLSGGAKLVYLACRAGLRDHHLFARVRLATLAGAGLDAALADAEVTLLVCNPQMAVVAAIDVAGDAGASDAARAECLRGLGIRYLKLSPRALPRPDEIRALIYRM